MKSSKPPKILVVEDNPYFSNFLKDTLTKSYTVELAGNAQTALDKFQKMDFDIVLLDLGIPKRPGAGAEVLGFEILTQMKQKDALVEIIILTGTSREIDSAIRAIKEGAYYFIIKDDKMFAEKLQMTLQKALEKRELQRKHNALKRQAQYFAEKQKQVHPYLHPGLKYHFGLLLGESSQMHEIYETIHKLSRRNTEESVIIYGENGTGKELAALSIHATSPRGDRPWIVASIAALSSNLIESELFGIEEKTATGVKKRTGYFEQADGTSIFLDEIGEIPLDVQVKLLRVLQEKEIHRIGLTKPIPIDARVITATNKNLQELIQQGEFRKDLFYRLEVIPITMPPLRDRKEDIPILIEHFLFEIQQTEKNSDIAISEDAIDFLCQYPWPGNIRELGNVIKKAAILRDDDLLKIDHFQKLLSRNEKIAVEKALIFDRLPTLPEIANKNGKIQFKKITDKNFRNKLFLRTLIEFEGIMEEVLPILDISRNTGYRFLEEAQYLILSGICRANSQIDQLAQAWEVKTAKLIKTIQRANRLTHYYQELQDRFAEDESLIAAFLNVTPDQLRQGEQFLKSTS